MLLMGLKNLARFCISFAIFAILLFGFSRFGMDMGMKWQSIICPFSGHSMSICQMNPLEHIQELQNIFTTTTSKESFLFISTLLILLASLKLCFKLSIPKLPQIHSYTHSFYSNRFVTFNYLQEAFSSGILNPKSF